MFTCQQMSIVLTLLTTFKVTTFASIFIGVYWHLLCKYSRLNIYVYNKFSNLLYKSIETICRQIKTDKY